MMCHTYMEYHSIIDICRLYMYVEIFLLKQSRLTTLLYPSILLITEIIVIVKSYIID